MEDLIRRSIVRYDTLIDYGFQRLAHKHYIYKKLIQNGMFEIVVEIKEGKIASKVMDVLFTEEYRGHLSKTNLTGFKRDIFEEYTQVMKDIKEKCTFPTPYIGEQANRLADYIKNRYDADPECLWGGQPGYSVFRNSDKGKWFAGIMNVTYDKLGINKKGKIEILNVKLDENTIKNLLELPGYHQAYHMNKRVWISVELNDSIEDEQLIHYIDQSYEIVNET